MAPRTTATVHAAKRREQGLLLLLAWHTQILVQNLARAQYSVPDIPGDVLLTVEQTKQEVKAEQQRKVVSH
jgi:hypothetical protein